MRFQRIVVVFAVMLIILITVAGYGTGAAANAAVKIGFLGALTGDVAMYGQPTLVGMKMAAEKVNKAGGVNGKNIEIVEADNRGDKQECATIVQRFISRG